MPNRLPVFLALLLLSGLLLAATGAHGAPAASVPSSSALEEEEFEGPEEEQEEEEESEAEAIAVECEVAREEADDGELDAEELDEICAEVTAAGKRKKSASKKAGGDSVAPRECLLRSAQAHASVNPPGDKLKLTIGYTAYEPVGAKVEVRKGSSLLTAKSLRLGRSGVLRIVKDLGKAGAPKRVVVRLVIPNSPGFCGKYETEKVAVR